MPTGSLPKALKDAGHVEDFRDNFRAHVRYLEDGTQKHIRGPIRTERSQAQKDLEDMRACGALFGEDRTKGLEAMRAEAGPLTIGQGEPFLAASRRLASLKAIISWSLGNQFNQKAMDQWRAGLAWASKAGSKVPLVPSRA